MSTPLRLKEMTPDEVALAIAANPRLIVPAGTCEPHGPHLPFGSDTVIVERLADDLSAEFRIVRAPTIGYGVNAVAREMVAGSASVRRKTLRRWLNDLLQDWERTGVEEFLVLTAHGHAPHQEALSTVVTDRARVRVVDVFAIDLAAVAETAEGPIHGGEIDTSLMLYLAPQLVRMDLARDTILPETERRRYRRGTMIYLPAASQGSVGAPTRASAERGRAIYEFIRGRITERVLGRAPAAEVAP
ncbi:MAG TPA: creatininase family protein [Gemmatimonadales bacterium]|nr:creatininase family protein [Gemmatimonadales bacterium]